jgi:hypothetical protein
MNFRIQCPHCNARFIFTATPPTSNYRLVCQSCQEEFDVLFARIRTSRSRGSRRDNTREFDVRITTLSNNQQLIRFENSDYDNFVLLSRDEVGFYYVNGRLCAVHNFTICRLYEIRQPTSQSPCYLATYVYGSHSEEVLLLRQFRDEVMLPRASLAALVHLYYWASPKMLQLFGDSHICKAIVARIIAPLVWLVQRWARGSVSPRTCPAD